jgi:hypothetical protein
MPGMSDEQLLDDLANMANGIVSKLNAARRPGTVTEATELLMRRIVAAGNSLSVLRRHAHQDVVFDGAMVLRGIYDAMLQALFILNDSARWDERSQLFLDSFWVDHKRQTLLLDKNPTFLARQITSSPKRAAAEPAYDLEFNRVQAKFLDRKGKLRENWYVGNLRDLATEVNLEAEYELLQKWLSGFVHSSAFALRSPPSFDGFLLSNWAWQFSFRVLGKFAEYAGVQLSEEESGLIRISTQNIFDPCW